MRFGKRSVERDVEKGAAAPVKRGGLARVLCLSVAILSAAAMYAEREDGWYLVENSADMNLAEEPIVTTDGFAELRLDSAYNSDGEMVYMVAGRMDDENVPVWAAATEGAIGRQIAFVYRGGIVCAPMVNARIESGNFSISGTDVLIKEIYRDWEKRRAKDVQL